MADAVACGIQSVLIRYLRHEVRCRINRSSIDKLRRIEVTVDRRTDGVVAGDIRSTHDQSVVDTIRHQCLVIVDCIQVDESGIIAVVDILRHGKRKREFACAYAVLSVEENLRTVVIDEGLISTISGCIIQLTDDRLF